VSATPKADRQLSRSMQFWAIALVLALSGVVALIVLARVAGKHGACPSETQTSRPAASRCFAAYTNPTDPSLVG
jgi:hypothetical protein